MCGGAEMIQSQLAWITGFYEGEGSTGCWGQTHSKWYTLCLTIAQRDKSPLTYIKNVLHFGSINRVPANGNTRRSYRFRCAARKAEWLLKAMLPFMKSEYKIKQAKQALNKYSRVISPRQRLGKLNPNWRGGTAHA